MSNAPFAVFRDLFVSVSSDGEVCAGIPFAGFSSVQLSLVTVGALDTAQVSMGLECSNDLENWTSLGGSGHRGSGSFMGALIEDVAAAFVRVRCSIDEDIAIVSVFASLGRAT